MKPRNKLRMLYKRYKTGLVKEEDLTPKERELLRRYYNVKMEGERSEE